jgi:DNA-binding CsgD family transcriptional regulator
MNTYTFPATPREMIQTRRIGSGMTKWSSGLSALSLALLSAFLHSAASEEES